MWKHCAPVIASAVERFSDDWGPYSFKSRRYSIYRLLRELIDPAWQTYLTLLPSTHRARDLCTSHSISETARSIGFRALEDRIISLGSSPHMQGQDSDMIGRGSASERADDCSYRTATLVDEIEFDSTIDTLRELILRCRLKRPAKERVSDLTASSFSSICELCGLHTEFEAYRRGADWSLRDSDLKMRLSRRYCAHHRPKSLDGALNPFYRRAMRSRHKFEEEATRLAFQTTGMSAIRTRTEGTATELFLSNVAVNQALYFDEESEIRTIARSLVDARLSDRKKQIVMLSAAGLTQQEIALRLGISRQAVWKALNSIPDVYRLDRFSVPRK